MRRNEIPLYTPRRRGAIRGFLLAVAIAIGMAAAVVHWGDLSNWGLQ
jgi:hypothetical protein